MRKYENFCNALSNMKDIYNYEEPYDNVVITGLVGLYEICFEQSWNCLLYTSDAADEEDSVDLGGRRIHKKKNKR